MSAERKIYVEHQSLAEYQEYEPRRLGEADVTEHGLYHLMMRTEGVSAPAVRACVFVQNIRSELGHMAFALLYTDRDLQPVTKKPHESVLEDRYWKPRTPFELSSPKTQGLARIGFLMPYDAGLDIDLDKWSESLLLSGSR